VSGAQVDQPAYNSSPITKGAMFTAVKPDTGQPPEELTKEESAMAESGGCLIAEEKQGSPPGIMRQIYMRFGAYVVFLLVILFGVSGRLDWIHAWVYLALVAAFMIMRANSLTGEDEDMLLERMRAFRKENIQSWDKVLAPLVAVAGPVAILLACAMETRYHWPPPVPVWISVVAFCVYVAGFQFSRRAMMENRFFSAVARVQTDRGHKLVDTGPYSRVRHPGYAGAMVFHMATPLALGSLWGVIPAVITAVLLVIRAWLEDRFLAVELDGYREYSRRVTSRLVPRVW